MENIRVLLADDHELVRAGIRLLLEKAVGINVIGEASDGHDAIRLVEEHIPDVVLTDIAMPGLNGLEVTRHLTKTFPKVRVVILSMHSDEGYVSQALRAGAAGYLFKGASREELEVAIRSVAGGETYISPLASSLLTQHLDRGSSATQTLSARQQQVLKLIAEGKNTKQIALALTISVKTVESHRMQLMNRLDIHDIPGLVRFAIKTGLVKN